MTKLLYYVILGLLRSAMDFCSNVSLQHSFSNYFKQCQVSELRNCLFLSAAVFPHKTAFHGRNTHNKHSEVYGLPLD